MGANRETVPLETYRHPKNDKTVVFVPMIHIAKPTFYKDVKKKLDSLRAEGFVVFYESVSYDRKKYGSKELDTLDRKIRKMLGIYFSSYKDSTNASLPKAFFNDKYVLQSRSRTGIGPPDINVDLPLDTLLKMYEEKYGEIKLAPCDFTTPLKADYDCKTLNSEYVLHTARDEYIVQHVRQSAYKKIVLVYGKAHFRFIGKALRKKGFVEMNR